MFRLGEAGRGQCRRRLGVRHSPHSHDDAHAADLTRTPLGAATPSRCGHTTWTAAIASSLARGSRGVGELAQALGATAKLWERTGNPLARQSGQRRGVGVVQAVDAQPSAARRLPKAQRSSARGFAAGFRVAAAQREGFGTCCDDGGGCRAHHGAGLPTALCGCPAAGLGASRVGRRAVRRRARPTGVLHRP